MTTNRYQRQEIIPGFGAKAQQKLKTSSVLMVGCGALGCVASNYLARAGVGKIILVDDDVVSETNLHRQILFQQQHIGMLKVEVAYAELSKANPEIKVLKYHERVTSENVDVLIENCDVVIDGTDNFATKYIVNDSAVKHGKPMVYGAVNQYEGQVTVFNVLDNNGEISANMRDLFPVIPASDNLGNCELNGVLGPVAGIIGDMMALECIKLLTGIGETLANRLLTFDALDYRMHFMGYSHREVQIELDPFALTWEEYRALPNPEKYILLDVREEWERAARPTKAQACSVTDDNLKSLTEIPIPIFHCVSGQRAYSAMKKYMEFHPGAAAFYVGDALV